MKEGWIVKKLGEVCEIQGGSTPKRTERLFWENGTYPWFTVDDIREQGRVITDTKQKVTLLAWDKLRKFPKDTIMLCCTASVGEYAITKIPITSNQQFNGLVIKDKYLMSPMYLFYYVSTLKHVLKNLSGKATIDFVSAEKVRSLQIPIPPFPEQSRIVEELDLLSNIIEKKRQQLSELDNLAQSIFYDMFGDPVTNEKGWEVKKIGEISTFYNGKAHEKNIVEFSEILLVNAKFISSNGEIKKYSDIQLFPLYKNDITMVMSDLPNGKTLAKCYLIEKDDTYTLNQRICAFRGYDQNPIFLKYVLNRNKYYLSFDDGNGQTNLRKSDVVNCPIIIPPLHLQQLFAQKIEAIEKEKELIKQSIKETEELFNSRMDYYFG